MAKLYFKYGVMGSSKTAQALIAKFNYEQDNGMKVLLIKPETDTRDGADIVKSRIGLQSEAFVLQKQADLRKVLLDAAADDKFYDVVICDEAQFLTPEQVEHFKSVAVLMDTPVLCYGLLTDFKTMLFPGSKRLVELADSLTEIKTVCECGAKATVSARFADGEIVRDGEQVQIGGNESYKSMCYKCWRERSMRDGES